MNYAIWDQQSPINGVPAKKFISMMGCNTDDVIYIITNNDGNVWITQTLRNSPFEGQTIEEKAINHLKSLQNDLNK